jgi:hypothetical protein
MARYFETGAALHPRRRILEDTARHLRNAPASLAADVLVVVVPHLVMGLAIAQVDPPDGAFAFHRGHSTEDGRIVGSAEGLSRRLVQLVE